MSPFTVEYSLLIAFVLNSFIPSDSAFAPSAISPDFSVNCSLAEYNSFTLALRVFVPAFNLFAPF